MMKNLFLGIAAASIGIASHSAMAQDMGHHPQDQPGKCFTMYGDNPNWLYKGVRCSERPLDDVQIPTRSTSVLHRLGPGSFGYVFRFETGEPMMIFDKLPDGSYMIYARESAGMSFSKGAVVKLYPSDHTCVSDSAPVTENSIVACFTGD